MMHVYSNLGVVFNLPQFPFSIYPNLFFPKKWRPPELTCNIILATIKSSSSEDNAPPWLCLRWCECGFHLAQFPSQYSNQNLFLSKKTRPTESYREYCILSVFFFSWRQHDQAFRAVHLQSKGPNFKSQHPDNYM